MLRFKQFLIEKAYRPEEENIKDPLGGLNTPVSLEDFEDEPQTPKNFKSQNYNAMGSGGSLGRIDVGATEKDRKYYEDQKKKSPLQYPLDFDEFVKQQRQSIQDLAMGTPSHKSSNFGVNIQPQNWVGKLNDYDPQLANIAVKMQNTADDYLKTYDRAVGRIFGIGTPYYDKQDVEPLEKANLDRRKKEARNQRLLYTPGYDKSGNKDPEGYFYDSPEYFDEIEDRFNRFVSDANKNKSYNPIDMKSYQTEDEFGPTKYDLDISNLAYKFSPMDILSLQFGRENTNQRNEYLRELKKYQQIENESAKTAGKYAELPDMARQIVSDKYDPYDQFLYGSIPLFASEHLYTKGSNFQEFLKPLKVEDLESKFTEDQNTVALHVYGQRPYSDRSIYSQNPKYAQHVHAFKDKQFKNIKDGIDLVKQGSLSASQAFPSAIVYNSPTFSKLNRDQILSVLGHEYVHRRQPKGVTNPLINSNMIPNQQSALDRMNAVALKNDKDDEFRKYTSIAVPELADESRKQYTLSRKEVPAYMHDLKNLVYKNTGVWPKANQSDAEIEKNLEDLQQIILDRMGTYFSPGEVDAMNLLSTPEGKAIWRGVQNTPKPRTTDRIRKA
jgi:hypothetical protein